MLQAHVWEPMQAVRCLRVYGLGTTNAKPWRSFRSLSWMTRTPLSIYTTPTERIWEERVGNQGPRHWPAPPSIIWLRIVLTQVEEVGKKNRQLKNILSKTRWPNLTCFEANGCTHVLPLRNSCAALGTVADATLRFLAGFFDGDGYVACQSDLSGCILGIGQSFDHAEILMLFRDTFGGGITADQCGLGLRKPILRWRVYGQSCQTAAQLLAPHSITKQKQLLLAAKWAWFKTS